MKTFLIVAGIVIVLLFGGYCIALHAEDKVDEKFRDYDEGMF